MREAEGQWWLEQGAFPRVYNKEAAARAVQLAAEVVRFVAKRLPKG